MLASFLWLRELLPGLPDDVHRVADDLTMAGIEVEEVRFLAPPFDRVVVGHVLEVRDHPQAQKLKICRVQVGEVEPLQIVCGDPHIATGMMVPCALPGARLPGGDGSEIAVRQVRDVVSQGMLCSPQELGMVAEENRVWSLPEIAAGTDLRQALQLDDAILELKPTPNRGDCLSMVGIARELAAIYDLPVPKQNFVVAKPSDNRPLPIQVEAPEACPAYFGQILRGISQLGPTPLWMRLRLERCGQRAISPVVDITNYVMLELGQPLHAFDAATIEGRVIVRISRGNESLTLLDGQKITTAHGSNSSMLLICDEKKPLAAAGVMGGLHSGVTANTRDILLESAHFTPGTIQGRAKQLAVTSEAAHRFERGVDPALPEVALNRAVGLLLEICGGRCAQPVSCVSTAHQKVRTPVLLERSQVCRRLGIDLPFARIKSLLERVAAKVQLEGDEQLRLTAPSHRFDLILAEDWIEEVARLHGYDHIPSQTPCGALQIVPNPARSAMDIRRLLAARDYQEIVSYSFVAASLEKDFSRAVAVPLANPMTTSTDVMRSTLWGSMVLTLQSNLRHQQSRVRLFEISRLFTRVQLASDQEIAGIDQSLWVGGLAFGDSAPLQWGVPRRAADFFDVLGDLQALAAPHALSCQPNRHPAIHPERSGAIWVGGRVIGAIGELHPSLVQKYDLPSAPVLFEAELAPLLQRPEQPLMPPMRYPEVVRDLAVVLPDEVLASEIAVGLHTASPLVRQIQIFDLYRGKNLEEGQKSLAFRVTLGDWERTLDEATVVATMAKLETAAENLGARIRRY